MNVTISITPTDTIPNWVNVFQHERNMARSFRYTYLKLAKLCREKGDIAGARSYVNLGIVERQIEAAASRWYERYLRGE